MCTEFPFWSLFVFNFASIIASIFASPFTSPFASPFASLSTFAITVSTYTSLFSPTPTSFCNSQNSSVEHFRR